MYAYEIPGLRFSLPAGEAIARRRFVTVNSASAGIIATAGGSVIGVSMNQTDADEVLEISDGIVIVEAAAAIVAGVDVQVGTEGKAITKTTGIGVGVAITGASTAGQFVTVKLMSVSNANGTNGINGAATQTIIYTASDLAAGADLTDTPIGASVGDGTITAVTVISLGAAAGIDDSNTSEFVLEVGTTSKATKTFNSSTAFPASGTATTLTVASDTISAGDVLLLSVTNGTTADLPAFLVQVVVTLD